MKKLLGLLLGLSAALCLRAEDLPRIEKELRQSAPGLPEFRVFQDQFGTVRSVRTLPGEKASGSFSLRSLTKYPRIAMLDLSGLAELDVTDLGQFRELRTLKAGALRLKGWERAASGSVIRLDLSETDLKDAAVLRKFPAVRILLLPPGVTDITPLRDRSFRALSAPGVSNLDAACAELNIQVNIRTGRPRRRAAGEAHPAAVEKDAAGRVTAFRLWRLQPPEHLNTGFTGLMFPEELKESPAVPPADVYPPLQKVNWEAPLKLSVFSGDRESLRELDLRACRAVEIRGESFPELRVLRLSGAVSGLETLKAPKLRCLHLERIEGATPGGRPPRPRSPFRFQDHRRRPGVPLTALPPGLDLELLRVTPARDEFDFDSIRKIRVRRLECTFRGPRPDFLRGAALEHLQLTAPNVTGKAAAVLGSLPLKELKIRLGDNCDYGFLGKLKLKTLSLNGGRGGTFTPEMLNAMPLRSLHLRNPSAGPVDWTRLRLPALQELILSQTVINDLKFLRRLTALKNLALENCIILLPGLTKEAPALEAQGGRALIRELLRLPKLRNLRLGQTGVFDWKKFVNSALPLEELRPLKLENLSVCTDRADWVGRLPTLRKLKIDDISKSGLLPEQIKCSRELKVLTLTNIRPRPDRSVPESRPFFRRPVIPAPRFLPGVAEKCYMEVPGGFHGGFLSTFPGIRGF